jgi:hypothetical protein
MLAGHTRLATLSPALSRQREREWIQHSSSNADHILNPAKAGGFNLAMENKYWQNSAFPEL